MANSPSESKRILASFEKALHAIRNGLDVDSLFSDDAKSAIAKHDASQLKCPDHPLRASSSLPVSNKTIACFQGGGFISLCGFSAVISGLAAASGSTSTADLMKNIGGLSTSSGGGWFAAYFTMSPTYLALLDDLAKNPAHAETLYQKGWVEPMQSIGMKPCSDGFNLAAFKAIYHFLLEKDCSWTGFVEYLLEYGAKIDPKTMSTAAPNPWAEGKLWMVNCAVNVASSSTGAAGHAGMTTLQTRDLGTKRIEAICEYIGGAPHLPQILPTCNPFILGDGERHTNVPFCPAFSYGPFDANSYQMRYVETCLGITSQKATSLPGVLNLRANLEESSPNRTFPLAWAVSAGSAAAAGVSNSVLLSEDVAVFNTLKAVQLELFAPAASYGDSLSDVYDASTAIISDTSASIAAFSDRGVLALFDAGYTDNTGIATAIANGATNLVVFGGSSASSKDKAREAMSEIVVLFEKDNEHDDLVYTTPLKILTGIVQEQFPIFAGSSNDLTSSYVDLVSPSDASLVPRMALASVTLTTIENVYFGIPAGLKITLHSLLFITCGVNIGEIYNLSKYSAMVHEIVQTLSSADNKDAVTSWMAKALGCIQPS